MPITIIIVSGNVLHLKQITPYFQPPTLPAANPAWREDNTGHWRLPHYRNRDERPCGVGNFEQILSDWTQETTIAWAANGQGAVQESL